jgi:FlaG/FlaF family flagellin (archaellin)
MKEQQSSLNSEAVSPVIGVMLMLVVTIIVAAGVSAFAGGVAGDQKETPVAQIDIKLVTAVDSSGSVTPQLVFTHKGGDPISTSDLKIVTSVGGHGHVTDGSLDPADAENHFDAGKYAAGNGSFVTNDGYPCKMVNGACVPDGMWGNFTWMNGDILTTPVDNLHALESILGNTTLGVKKSSSGSGSLSYSDTGPITVEIVHIPSEKVIASSELVYV